MMRRIASALLLAGAFAAVPAGAASALTIRGAGFGHGVGMSQYGAAGFAEHGYTHAQILAHYFPGTEIGRVGTDTVVRVLLASPQTATFTGATNAGTVKLDPDQRYGARSASSGRVDLLDARGRVMATFDAPLRATNRADGPVTLLGTAGNGVRDGAYRGWLEFRPGAMGEVLAVNAVGLEQYVAGVIANEAIPSWPLEALESQAVASRGYALTTLRTEERGWDLYPDTRSQVYRGVTGENPNTNRAVNATAGEVVTYGGQPITTFYFSTSGGETENIENVWAGSPPAVLRRRRRPLRRRFAVPPLGADPPVTGPGAGEARWPRQGLVREHQGDQARRVAAGGQGRGDRHPRAHDGERRHAEGALRAARHVDDVRLPQRRRRRQAVAGSRRRTAARAGPAGHRRRVRQPLKTRVSVSATQTGLSAPSVSNVQVVASWMPPGTSSTPAIEQRMRTFEPTFSGDGKRTRLAP